ncbi:WD40 repeat domain-containing protein [Williamsia maris]|uniref:WD40 repeat n=1 Tax=Williamsia maris TaxID=72806 RepID=A0ABT1HAD7_9NOCA|nr:WD40 repeat domain-containing protein [Williamsia maris]MCP2174641.1 WD40 repeat [Williamsia maris]
MHDTVVSRAASRSHRPIAELPPQQLGTDETYTPTDDSDSETVVGTRATASGGPYRPLTPYLRSDAELFSGRTELWRRLHVRAIPGNGPVTVLGPCGSGKTSLLHAGLIPAVERMGLRLNDTRVPAVVATMTPGPTPLAALADTFGADPELLDAEPDAWVDAVAGRADAAGHASLLVIDQAEELFTLCDRATRTSFLRVVDALAADSRIAVVLGLQAEFYPDAAADPVLVRTLEDRAVVVRMMIEDEIVDAIELPARIRGATVESGLAAEIAHDLSRVESTTPPLIALGVLMDHLWRTRGDSGVTRQAYRASDPVADIVGVAADRAISRLSATDRVTARLVLLATVRFTEAGHLVGTGVTAAGLESVLSARPRTGRVLAHLVDAGVLTVDTNGGVRLAHESLVGAWPRLAGWIDERRTDAPVLAALQTDAAGWEADHRPDSSLYGGDRLRAATRAVQEIDSLSPDAAYFLSRSRERAALRTSRRRVLLGLLVIVAVVASVLAITQFVRGGDASTGRDAARLDATLARVAATTVTDPSAAATLALAAYREAPQDPRTRSALLATQSSPVARTIGTPDPSVAVAASGDGRRVALTGADGVVRILSTATPTGQDPTPAAVTVPAPSTPVVGASAALNADGSVLARRGETGSLELWRIAGNTPTRVSTIAQTATDRASGPQTVSFSAVRPWLAATDATGTVRIWDVSDAAAPAVVGTVAGAPTTVLAWNPRRPQLLAGSAQGATLWDLTDPSAPRSVSSVDTAGRVDSIALDADGRRVAVGDTSGSAALFDLGANGLLARGPGVAASSGGVESLSFAPGGTRLALTSADGTAQVWDVTHPDAPRRALPALRSQTSALASTVFTDESTLISAGTSAPIAWSLPTGLLDGGFGGALPPACSVTRNACVTSFARGPVQVWDASDPTAPRAIAAIDGPGHFNGATMSPDGLWMMTSDSRHLAQLWDVRDIRKPVAVGAPLALGREDVDHMVFSPSSSQLATSTAGGTQVQIWDVSLRGLAPLATVGLGGVDVDAVAFGADSGSIALGGADGAVRRWAVSQTGASPVSGVFATRGPVTAITAAGTTFLAGDATGSLTRWDERSGRQIGAGVVVGSSAITSIATTGASTVVAGADGRLHRLDADGTVLDAGSLFGPNDKGDSAITTITPTTVVASGATGRQQFWTIDPTTVARQICARTAAGNC